MTAITTEPNVSSSSPSGKWKHSAFGIVCVVLILAVRLAHGIPFGFVYDPNREHCLTTFHLGVFLLRQPTEIRRDDLVMFLPVPQLAYVREPYVGKQVAAVAGDHLVIKGQSIIVNGREVAHGLPLAANHKRAIADLQRDETVPPGQLFVLGNHPLSDDSRYWGYLDASKVAARVHRLF